MPNRCLSAAAISIVSRRRIVRRHEEVEGEGGFRRAHRPDVQLVDRGDLVAAISPEAEDRYFAMLDEARAAGFTSIAWSRAWRA